MMDAAEYKTYHESFMENNHGTTAFHTFCCIIFTVQCAIYISIRPKYSPSFQYVYEYFVMVLPMIIVHTILAEYIYVLNSIIFTILLRKVLSQLFDKVGKKFSKNNFFKNERIPFVTSLRGLTYIITVFAILAVDFQAFPRYLAKTERYGYSLMDTGVGMFVAVSGIVHKDLHRGNYKDIIKGNLKVVTMLLILGVGRYLSVKQLDYHEHVTEYGVHWNFFFTIAVCKSLSTITLCFSKRALILSAISLGMHELILYIDLQDWVFSESPRTSLISANREGISSCLGYVSIYLYAVHIKQWLITKNVTRYAIQKRLVLETVLLWILTYFINVIRPTSRTLANAAYVVYLDTILITIMSMLYFITILYDDKDNLCQESFILSSVNTNGLTYFLIANLLTGAVNLSIKTLTMSSAATFVILNVYMILTTVFIVYIKRFGLRI